MTDRECIYLRSNNGVTIPEYFLRHFKDTIRDQELPHKEMHGVLKNNIVRIKGEESYVVISCQDENGHKLDDIFVFGWKEC